MADKVEILLRARGGRQVASESRVAAGGIGKIERSAVLAHRASGKLTTGLHALGKGALYAGGALAAGLVVEVKRGTQAWEEHRKTAADVRQVIKTTGGAANVSAKHVDRLANAIQAKAAVDDDAVASGERVLLTFTRVRNEQGKGNKVFDRATRLAVDMSKRFGTDTRGAFVQLGKALDDPTKGLLALRRTGVSFTAAEQKKIKVLEQTGHHLQAQRIILAALDKQVGGSARAQATPIERLKQTWGDLEKQLGGAVAPTVDSVARKLDRLTGDASKIFGRHDLSFTGKVRMFSQRDVEPEVRHLVRELKAAHLDDKLEHAFEWAAPKIATGLAHSAPRAAGAFVHAFANADAWGKVLTAGFLAKKLGVAGGLARLLMGGRGGLGGAAVSMKPVPVYVVNGDAVHRRRDGGPAGRLGKWGTIGRFGAGVVGVGGAIELLHLINDISHGHTNTRGVGVTGRARTLRDRQGNLTAILDPSGRATPVLGAAAARLSGYPDSHPVSRSTRLDGYPDSHWLTSAVRSGVHPLDRLPDKVAGAVARRPLALTVHSQPVNIFVDGVKVANATAQVELKYKDRG